MFKYNLLLTDFRKKGVCMCGGGGGGWGGEYGNGRICSHMGFKNALMQFIEFKHRFLYRLKTYTPHMKQGYS